MPALAARGEVPARHAWRVGLGEAGPLALAGIVANGGSMLVTLVLARVLATHGYGALNQLVGVFFVVSTPGSAVLVGVVRRVSRWQGTTEEVGSWGAAVHRRASRMLALFAGVVLVAGAPVARLLGRHDPVGFDAVAIAGGVWVLLCVDRGLLQAHRNYRTLSQNLVVEGGARTVCMIGFGAAGMGATGVAAGVLVAEVCTALHARMVAQRTWGERRERATVGVGQPACAPGRDVVRRWTGVGRQGRCFGQDRVVRRDVVTAVGALASIAVLQNIDVIVMGREGPEAAGAYAAVSVSSKAIVFVAMAVAGYLLPEAAISWREGRHALRQLSVALTVLAVPGTLLLGVAAVLPRAFLATAYSRRYVSAAGAFLPLALAMVCLSATVMVTTYLLGVGDRRFVRVLVGGAFLATAAVVLAHGVPRTTALCDFGVQAAILGGALGELARVHRASGCTIPTTPGPDSPTTPSPDSPTTPGPGSPTTPSLDSPTTRSLDSPTAPSLGSPTTPSLDSPTTPSRDSPASPTSPADPLCPASPVEAADSGGAAG